MKILVTMGDPNGVGPEICARAMPALLQISGVTPVLIGHKDVFMHACAINGVSCDIEIWEPPRVSFTIDDLKIGTVDAKAGAAAIAYVKYAVELIQRQEAGAMVTAPISKEAIEIQIPHFQGHTEFIGEMCGDPEPVLTLVHGDKWVISHVSTHVSLREACDRCKRPRIVKTARLLHDFLQKFVGIMNPKIGIAGLNPHAGENGLFGVEEQEEIEPAVAELKEMGILVKGPLPGDVVFPQMKAGTFDGVVAMYHDQGHVVTKTLGFDLGDVRKLNGVNLTLGLPVIRTSVDHGTAFDIAWQGMADHHSLLDAYEIAARLVE
jgi:4-phospho-D-threonate 3-dehydrogenase / 4-phospho-D-erythronate 3-dehydrogenase